MISAGERGLTDLRCSSRASLRLATWRMASIGRLSRRSRLH